MKVLLCGANGMLGSNLSENSPSNVLLLTPDINELNLLDYNQTYNYLKKNKPDFIIHAAGIVGGIHANIEQPVKFLLENTDMGRNLVWAAFNNNIKQLLNLGSSCMYPRNAKNPLKEDLILKGELEPTNEGYALAKIFTQRLCSYINKQHPDFAYKTAIPCNLYGKYDKFGEEHSHMIPAVINKIHNAKIKNEQTVTIWGDGSARREFMYAKDCAQILWSMVNRFNEIPEIMNVGLGYDYTITEYYKTIADIIGYKGDFDYDLTKPTGMKQKLVDISIQKNIGLKPEHSLQSGIKETYRYYIKDMVK